VTPYSLGVPPSVREDAREEPAAVQQRSGRQPVVARTVLDTSVLAEAMRATRT